ncbi:hypothetical protein [Campylobacter geochelonis]|uniref:hypothetical protein n=1 Tax=Campylobacter geochelonis TaxID=1780362 RepID=UPI001A9630B8|nr:hypothetical protein [Campylobacter geochelonis]
MSKITIKFVLIVRENSKTTPNLKKKNIELEKYYQIEKEFIDKMAKDKDQNETFFESKTKSKKSTR